MSRLRRLVLSDRYFFITCQLLPPRRLLGEAEFECQTRVIAERRTKHRFVLTAWVFLPGHGHAIFYPASLLTIALVMECIQVSSTSRLNAARHESGKVWQPSYFDRVLRTVREYREKVDYQNPVRAGLVKRARSGWRQKIAAELSTLWVVLENAMPKRMKGYGCEFKPQDQSAWERLIRELLRDIDKMWEAGSLKTDDS